MFSTDEISQIKTKSLKMGFHDVKFMPIFNTDESFQKEYYNYLNKNFQADMKYLENTEAKFNIHRIYENAKTIAVFSLPYMNSGFKEELSKHPWKISAYASGKDYHLVVKERLQSIVDEHGPGRIVCDSTPLPERYYGFLAGLGFLGKNSMLIHPEKGSFFFLSFILFEKKLHKIKNENRVNLKNFSLNNHEQVKNDMLKYCKDCHRCIDACPGNALDGSGYLDSGKCYSYWSIENKSNQISYNFKNINYIFGCDICQQVCPYNKNSEFSTLPEFKISDLSIKIMDGKIYDLQKSILKETSFYRAGISGLKRNLNYLCSGQK